MKLKKMKNLNLEKPVVFFAFILCFFHFVVVAALMLNCGTRVEIKKLCVRSSLTMKSKKTMERRRHEKTDLIVSLSDFFAALHYLSRTNHECETEIKKENLSSNCSEEYVEYI